MRVSWNAAFKRWYHLEVAGAPNTCEMNVSFASDPIATTPATTISLRRNPRR